MCFFGLFSLFCGYSLIAAPLCWPTRLWYSRAAPFNCYFSICRIPHKRREENKQPGQLKLRIPPWRLQAQGGSRPGGGSKAAKAATVPLGAAAQSPACTVCGGAATPAGGARRGATGNVPVGEFSRQMCETKLRRKNFRERRTGLGCACDPACTCENFRVKQSRRYIHA